MGQAPSRRRHAAGIGEDRREGPNTLRDPTESFRAVVDGIHSYKDFHTGVCVSSFSSSAISSLTESDINKYKTIFTINESGKYRVEYSSFITMKNYHSIAKSCKVIYFNYEGICKRKYKILSYKRNVLYFKCSCDTAKWRK
jgi:hypothetical protein